MATSDALTTEKRTMYTPGPWWTDARYDVDEMGCSIIAANTDCGPLPGNPTRGQVAFATAILNTDARRCEANARLIASAPELLALAKRYASACAECGGSGLLCGACGRALSPYEASGTAEELSCCTTPHRYVCNACADIRAVIEKAEGGA